MSRRKSILGACDESVVTAATTRALPCASFDVIAAGTEAESLQIAEDGHPGLVLMDMVLLDEDGRQIMAAPALKASYVVLTSGQADSIDVIADGHLVLPVHDRELLAGVRTTMGIELTEDSLRESEERFARLYRAVASRKDGAKIIGEFRDRSTAHQSRPVTVTATRDNSHQKHTDNELPQEQTDYRTVADFTYDWESWETPEGVLCYVSPSCERMTGYTAREFMENPHLLEEILLPDDRKLWDEHRREVMEHSGLHEIQFRIRRRDGEICWIEHGCQPVMDEQGQFQGFRASNRDITGRKMAESERNITVELLSRAGVVRSLDELLGEITPLLQRWSGCQAVGVRLRKGDDFPYYETQGFSSDFVMQENSLCAVDAHGNGLRDNCGDPFLECMCGNVICGRFDPKLPFFTERGSFWTNSTSELLASRTETERQARTRNRCHGEGYESVALIPLSTSGETFGLLQFNDRRKDVFTEARIGLFERLAYNIASAVAQQNAVEALRVSEEELARKHLSLVEAQRISHLGNWDWNVATGELYWSDEVYRVFGVEPQEFAATYDAFLASVHPEDRQMVAVAADRALADPDVDYAVECRIVCPDNSQRVVHVRGLVTFDQTGRPVRMVGTVQDITERKEAEQKLRDALAKIETLKDRLRAENVYLQEEIKATHGLDEIVGRSDPLQVSIDKIEQVATTNSTVLLLGETGTGKELFARAIHSRSPRSDRPLVKVDCGALPATLIESEFFGHVEGAFTGAASNKLGRFELADGGTIFLDEIGELHPDLQMKLLRVLQEGVFERVGSAEAVKVDVRVIAATNRDLHRAIEAGVFRPELYYRLAVFPIEVPPLRQRREDIPLLAWHFITKKQHALGKAISTIPKNVLTELVDYGWPGNVRELENVIERSMILSPGPALVLNEALAKPAGSPRPSATSCSLKEVDRTHIVDVLEDCDWKIKGANNAADHLGLAPSTLRHRMKRLGIERPPKKPR